jgi:hypothetical protein
MSVRSWLVLAMGAVWMGCLGGSAAPRSACSDAEQEALAEGVHRLAMAMGNRDLAGYARTAEALERDLSPACAAELAAVGRMERAHAPCSPDEERMLSRGIGRALEAATAGDQGRFDATLRDVSRVVSPPCQAALAQRFGVAALRPATGVGAAEFVVADGSGGLVVPGVVHCDGGGCVGLR